jgi:hypothetical protein
MRIIKKLYERSSKTLFVSKVFDSVITRTELPMNFESLELSIGYGLTGIKDNAAKIGIDADDPLLKDNDARAVRILITFELFRLVVRRQLEKHIPRLIEDVIISRDMIRRGFVNDLSYIFYIFLSTQRITDIKDYIKFNLPWIIFKNHDNYYHELFYNYAKSRPRADYDVRTRDLFKALAKDLWDMNNLNECIKRYEDVIDAGN